MMTQPLIKKMPDPWKKSYDKPRKHIYHLVTKTNPKKQKCKKAKWLSEEALRIAEKRKKEKGKGVKERYPTECRV